MDNIMREVLLRSAMDRHIAEGGKLMYMGWGVVESSSLNGYWMFDPTFSYDEPCACALSALIIGKDVPRSAPMDNRYQAAADILKVDFNWLRAFVSGFDTCTKISSLTPEQAEAYDLGNKLHKDYNPTNASVLEAHE